MSVPSLLVKQVETFTISVRYKQTNKQVTEVFGANKVRILSKGNLKYINTICSDLDLQQYPQMASV